jgi:AAA family ATP:ADP antiporter
MTKTAENATDYSVQNTVRQVLFLPTTREEKYKAKQAIDTFFVRSGDVLSAGLIFAGTSYWSMNTQQFAMVNSALVVVWLVVAFYVGSRYQALTRE